MPKIFLIFLYFQVLKSESRNESEIGIPKNSEFVTYSPVELAKVPGILEKLLFNGTSAVENSVKKLDNVTENAINAIKAKVSDIPVLRAVVGAIDAISQPTRYLRRFVFEKGMNGFKGIANLIF
ncbi:unnamed protein product [Caenorhabditis angaria]|uniref:SXP/RAL-2 family protein Ani s 5-like cation-binding domain-containing protein n=1 Tax=Caenorhabditis angaria TaxID=860376 RepID=A0A9P1N149_9PELO|nr:unnamed protein product [Caenorhabditis angaria]